MITGHCTKCVSQTSALIRQSAVLKRRIIAVTLATFLLLYAIIGLAPSASTPLKEPFLCNDSFGLDREVDLRKISSYQFPDIAHYTRFIFPHYQERSQPWSMKHVVPVDSHVTVPAAVTGADYSHFKESMNLVRNLNDGVRKAYKDMKLIYFDLGLAQHQKDHLKAVCNCDVRPFPFDEMPSHFKVLKGYAWKPVCLQMVLNEYPFAMWMDASVRIKTSNLTWFFEKVKQQGVMAGEGGNSIAARTKEPTFKFLKEQPCLYRTSEFEGTFIAVYNTDFVETFFMRPWVSCALSMGCMVLDNYPLLHLQCANIDHYYHECHRYDQSVLSILLHRLYHNDIKEHMIKRFTFYQYCSEGEEWRILPAYINDYINAKWYTSCRYG